MKKLIFSTLTVLISLIIFNSCTKNKTLDFQKVDFRKVVRSSLAKDSSGYCKIDVQLLYPSGAQNDAVLQKIQQQIIMYAFDSSYVLYTPKQAVEAFSKVTFDGYINAMYAKSKKPLINNTPAVFHNEEWDMNTVILYNDNGVLSYELSRYSQTGGAEGVDNTQYLVFNLKTGEKIKQRDIFEEGFEPKLSDLLKKQIMIDNGFESEEQMINNGYFFAMNIIPNENFSVDENGITFIFNPYEIAVASMGQTEVLIPWKKIKSSLKKDSPIAKLISKK